MNGERAASRTAGLVSLLLGVCGASAVIWGLTLSAPDTFLSGDNAVKRQMAREWMAGAPLPDVSPPQDEWARQLWRDGRAPLQPPFVVGEGDALRYAFPLSFPVLAATVAGPLGGDALRFVPLLFLIVGWLAWGLSLARMGLGTAARVGWFAAGVFATSGIVYGTLFWEHAVAWALVHAAVALVLTPPPGSGLRRAVVAVGGGALLAAVGWLRPETFLLGGLLVTIWLATVRSRPALLAFVGFGVVAVSWLLFNQAVYGSWGGAHAAQMGEDVALAGAWQRFASMADHVVEGMPEWILVPFGVAALAATWKRTDERRPLLVLLTTAALFALALPFAVPNDGGLQWGPRYALVASPILLHLGARAWPAAAHLPRWGRVAVAVLAAALSLGYAWQQVGRAVPMVAHVAEQQSGGCRALRALDVEAVGVTDHLQAQLLLACAPAPVVLARSPEELTSIFERCGDDCDRVAWVMASNRPTPPAHFGLAGPPRIFCRHLDTFGIAHVALCARTPEALQ